KKDVFNLPDSRQTSFAGGKPSLSSERIYLFVSSSIPQRTLRNYVRTIADLDDPNIYIVLRGFIGGMKTVAPTQKFIGDLIKKNPDCVGECPSYQVNTIIDPLLFRRYAITTVPSVVYVPFIQMDGAGSEGLVENAAVSQFDTVHGDAPLDVLLEEINKKRQSGTLEGLISKLTVIPTP
ncbi:MAG: hypothetical protein HYR80_06875, partial [Nitrospirae bacterium]|nr:hypothetical protein [Nitrospirota bacterium]